MYIDKKRDRIKLLTFYKQCAMLKHINGKDAEKRCLCRFFMDRLQRNVEKEGVFMKKRSRFAMRRWTGQKITIFSLVTFVLTLCLSLGCNHYVQQCVQREILAQHSQVLLQHLGQDLADASDRLTDEARQFVITANIDHLYNYWHEVEVEQQREQVIAALENLDLPEQEAMLLAEAKRYSDILIDTETHAMRLILSAMQQDVEDFAQEPEVQTYVEKVLEYPLSVEEQDYNPQQMYTMARNLMYDESYQYAKDLIMTPIIRFQNITEQRLSQEAETATADRAHATELQFACQVLLLIFGALLLWTMQYLYILPMKQYTKELFAIPRDVMKMKVSPCGAYELYRFGQMFNRLGYTLERELDSRKQAEEKMRQARDEAYQANRAKSDFLSQMSHELRTPLGAVTGYLYLLEQTKLDQTQRRYCQSMRASANSLLDNINDILDFSKIESGALTFEQIDFCLPQLMSEVRDIFSYEAKQKGLFLDLIVPDNLPNVVCGDPTRLRQVLVNLMGNAVKFTKCGGVTLSASLVQSKEEQNTISFSVEDTGIGIAPEDINRIFEPFEQADAGVTRKYGGTGLGLGIAKRMVEALSDGKEMLCVDSTLGKGSRFYFQMQFAAPCGQQSLPEAEQVQTFAEKKTILLVDDHEINLTMETELLQSFGLSVVGAYNGSEAIELVEKCVFDMVLLDVRMPDMDGYTVAKIIRQQSDYRTVPILALTADAVAGVREQALAAGMNDVAVKPLKPQALYQLMQHYFELAVSEPELLATDKNSLFAVQEALQTLGGDRECLAGLCARFVRSYSRSAEYIAIHLKNGHLKNARAILHDLIGLSGNLCCNRLTNASRVLLDQLHEGKADSLESFTEIFAQTIEELREFMLPVTQKQSSAMESDVVHRLYVLCMDYDLDAATLFEQEKEQLQQQLPEDVYQQLSVAIEHYDFAQAAALLKETGE